MHAKTFAKRLLGHALRHILPEPEAPLAVLSYHSIGTGAPGSQPVKQFREQMRWLYEHPERFTVSAGGIPAAADRHATAVLITFDDGYLDNWDLARPVLDERGFKACFFVTTGFIDGDLGITKDFKNYRGLLPMTWEHVGSLAKQGHLIGLHGDRHLNFHRLSQSEAAEEMHQSAEKLLARTGLHANAFAYPFGLLKHQRQDLDPVFRDLGIRFAFTSMHARADIRKIENDDSYRYCIPRLRIDAADSMSVFAEKLNGYWDVVAPIQRLRDMTRRRRGAPGKLPRVG